MSGAAAGAARAIVEASAASDEAMVDSLQRAAFDYFLHYQNAGNGLVADTSRPGSPCSIAVVGFALSAYPVGVARGWITRGEALQRSLLALRFLNASDQSGSANATGWRGFYFHFLDMQLGTRVWQSEVSLIDSAFLLAGVLMAATYFDRDDAAERELRVLADTLFKRADWRWAQRENGPVTHGWKPECGFLNYGWEGYSEALLLYVLGLGSPTHALAETSFSAWTRTYQWENLYGHDFLYAGPLFIHQFSHAWLDLRGIRDGFMREKRCDYFENSRRATLVQREYALRNPGSFRGYDAQHWGVSAGDGPNAPTRRIDGRRQGFYGYAARGVPYGPDDGTLSGSAMLSSLVFAPDVVMPALRALWAEDGATPGGTTGRIRASGYNASVAEDAADGDPDWVAAGEFGLDQGLIVLMIENHRSGLPWRLCRDSAVLRSGLRRAGFSGGWL